MPLFLLTWTQTRHYRWMIYFVLGKAALFKTLKLSQKVEATGDQRYGPIEVKRLATSKTYRAMVVNADSYTWLACEVFWSAYCKKPFDPADPAKDDDRTLFDNS